MCHKEECKQTATVWRIKLYFLSGPLSLPWDSGNTGSSEVAPTAAAGDAGTEVPWDIVNLMAARCWHY